MDNPRSGDFDRLIIDDGEHDRRFRPSDWVERISATLASFGPDHRLRYSEFAHPCVIQGQKCLVITRGLRDTRPEVFAFILDFARRNGLRIQEDRRVQAVSVTRERRNARWSYSEPTGRRRA